MCLPKPVPGTWFHISAELVVFPGYFIALSEKGSGYYPLGKTNVLRARRTYVVERNSVKVVRNYAFKIGLVRAEKSKGYSSIAVEPSTVFDVIDTPTSSFGVYFASGGETPVLFRAQGGGNAEHEAQTVCAERVHEATRVWLCRGQGTP